MRAYGFVIAAVVAAGASAALAQSGTGSTTAPSVTARSQCWDTQGRQVQTQGGGTIGSRRNTAAPAETNGSGGGAMPAARSTDGLASTSGNAAGAPPAPSTGVAGGRSGVAERPIGLPDC